MTKQELIQKLNQIEWEDFEVKLASQGVPKSIWETVSAFSNTSGGWIIFGVEEKNKSFNIVGVSNPSKLEQDFLNTLNTDKFNTKIFPKSEIFNFDDKIVLAFYIPISNKKPIYYNSLSNTYIRNGSGDRKATKEEIDTMYRDQSFGTKTSEIIANFSIDDLSMTSLKQYKEYLQTANPTSHYNKLSIDEFLHKVSVLVDKKPTFAGLLFFGKRDSINRYFVDFRIDLFEIPASNISESKTRYTYRLPEQENLWDYYFILFERITMRLDKPFKLDNLGFAKENYPYLEALREALVNMLMHADYFSPIKSRIRVFNDKIEFFNAGSYPKPVEYFLENDISDLEQSLDSREYANELYHKLLFLELMVQLNRAALSNRIEYLSTTASNHKMINVIDYLNAHLTDDITIDFLAEHFYLSRYHLMHAFKEETGYTIGNYLTTKRLLLARDQIAQGESITTACYTCGFHNYSTFSRAYRKHFGCSPREQRN